MLDQLSQATKDIVSALPPWAYVAVTGAVMAFWGRIKGFFLSALNHIGTSVELDGELGAVLFNRLGKEYGRSASTLGVKGYIVLNEQLRTGVREWLLARWISKDKREVFWIPHHWLQKHLGIKLPLPVTIDRGSDGSILTIRYTRGGYPILDVLREMVREANMRVDEVTRYCVHTVTGNNTVIPVSGEASSSSNSKSAYSPEKSFTKLPATAYYVDADFRDIGTPTANGAAETLWWPAELANVMDTAQKWHKSKEWYKKCDRTWKMGIQLYGLPGTGKTSTVRAIAIALDLPVYSFNLATMTTKDLMDAWRSVLEDAPAIALFEDFDAVYHGREPVQANQMLSTPPNFSALLECLDGAKTADGVLTFITTNYNDKLDPAIGGGGHPRPGRIDRIVKTPDTVSDEGKDCIINIVFKGTTISDSDRAALKEKTGECTPAVFNAACVDLLRDYL